MGDHKIISKYKSIFAKCYFPNWSEEVFIIKKVKNTLSWPYIITDCRSEQIFGTFYEKILQKKNQKEFRKKRVISRKGDKPYVKWKGYENSCNSWIDKK